MSSTTDHDARPAPPPASTPPGRGFTRRRFLRVAVPAVVGGAAAAALAARLDWLGAGTRVRRVVDRMKDRAETYAAARLAPADRIVRHFDYLQHDRDGVERFVRDFERRFGAADARGAQANRLLYTKYLLSTDFFLNGADESRPLRYVALHHPHATPCWNPIPPTREA